MASRPRVEVEMRSLLMASLLLLVAAPVRAQEVAPPFVFNGHHIGELKPSGEPGNQCRHADDGQMQFICAPADFNGVSFDARYTYDGRNRLRSVDALVESVGFEPLLRAFAKRYGRPKALQRGTGHDYAQWRFKEGRLHLTRTGSVIVLRFATGA